MTIGDDAWEFVSDAIRPVVRTVEPSAMAAGEPGLPREFVWRGRPLRIATVLRTWRETGPCRHGSAEFYVRKHWFEVRLGSGRRARIYFERQPRRQDRSRRWWLYTLERERGPPRPPGRPAQRATRATGTAHPGSLASGE